jgi:chromosome segregation ATPase
MEILKTILSLGTGSLWKGVSILLAGVLIATGLFSLKEIVSLHTTISDKETVIDAQGKAITKKESQIKELQEKISLKKAEIEVQNAVILANKIDTDKKLKAANEETAAIMKRYRTLWDDIYKWKGDENATTCDNARAFLNSRPW